VEEARGIGRGCHQDLRSSSRLGLDDQLPEGHQPIVGRHYLRQIRSQPNHGEVELYEPAREGDLPLDPFAAVKRASDPDHDALIGQRVVRVLAHPQEPSLPRVEPDLAADISLGDGRGYGGQPLPVRIPSHQTSV
jgi:hypothetical protein